MPDLSLLDPFERLIAIQIEGRESEVPENNSVLRILQYLGYDLDPCRLCWNSDCDNCLFAFIDPGSGEELRARGCETLGFEGLVVTRVPAGARPPAGD